MSRIAGTIRDRRAPEKIRGRILRSTNRFWRPTEFEASPSTVQHLLSALVEDGELRHVRRGLYWRGSKTPLGMSPPPLETLVRELAPGPGVGPSGLSAANALRLSTQIPRVSEVAVPGRAPSDNGLIRFVSRASRAGRMTAGLNATEVALLEALDAWEKVLEVPTSQAWTTLGDLLQSGAARADRLSRASRTEPGPVRVRLAALLRSSGEDVFAARVPAADPRTVALAAPSLALLR